MDWKEKLAAMFGLAAEASDEEILAAIEAAVKKAADNTATMAAEQRKDAAGEIAALTAKVNDLTTQIATMAATGHHDKAVQEIDAAIEAGKPIKPQRDTWIALYAADPEKTKAALDAIPSINGKAIEGGDEEDKVTLSADEAHIVKLMGLDKDKFLAARQDGKE